MTVTSSRGRRGRRGGLAVNVRVIVLQVQVRPGWSDSEVRRGNHNRGGPSRRLHPRPPAASAAARAADRDWATQAAAAATEPLKAQRPGRPDSESPAATREPSLGGSPDSMPGPGSGLQRARSNSKFTAAAGLSLGPGPGQPCICRPAGLQGPEGRIPFRPLEYPVYPN